MKRIAVILWLAFALFAGLPNALAQEAVPLDRPEPAHWAFASIIGTGWYKLDGGRSAFIFTASPRQHLRKSGFSDSGQREIGIFINYDAAIGLFEVDDLPGFIDSDNFSTVSFTPGIGFEIPVNQDWYLRASANIGWGNSFGDGTSAWIYYGGLKSRYQFGGAKRSWSLLNGLVFAGINPDGGPAQSVSGLFTGLEYAHPLPGTKAPEYRLHWQIGYTLIEDKVRIVQRDQAFQSIGNTAELGLSVSRTSGPFQLWFMSFDRLGLTYAVDSSGNFESLTFNFTSWFDK